jgi:hypothetical protein
MSDPQPACAQGETERVAPARARLSYPLRRPKAGGVGFGRARISSHASDRSEARKRRPGVGPVHVKSESSEAHTVRSASTVAIAG